MDIVFQDQSPLLRLPVEILGEILQYILHEPDVINYHTRVVWRPKEWKPSEADLNDKEELSKPSRPKKIEKAYEWDPWGRGRPNLSVLLACRQLYAHGRLQTFKKNSFVVNAFVSDRRTPSAECCFLGSLPLQDAFQTCPALCNIRHLCIKIHIDENTGFCASFRPVWRDVLCELPRTLSRQLQRLEHIAITVPARKPWQRFLALDTRVMLYRFGLLRADQVDFLGADPRQFDSLKEIMQGHTTAMDMVEYPLQLLNLVYDVLIADNHERFNGRRNPWLVVRDTTAYIELRRYVQDFVCQGELDLLLDHLLNWAVEPLYDMFDAFMEGVVLRAGAVKTSQVGLLPFEGEVQSTATWSQSLAMELRIGKLKFLGRYGRFIQLAFRQRVTQFLGRDLLSQVDAISLEVMRSEGLETLQSVYQPHRRVSRLSDSDSRIHFPWEKYLTLLRTSY